jgi:hypothetical protein
VKLFLSLILSLNLSVALASHSKTYWGAKVNVGNGYAQTFIKMHHTTPEEIGVVVSEDGLTNLPMHDMIEYTLPMPTEVAVFPYKHVTFNWNPHGHEPEGVYDKPHFDVHFYFITRLEQQAVTCMDDDLPICMQEIAPEYLVSDYAPTPAGVPKMGWHWVDLLSPEFNGGIFTRTLIYGYYGGIPTFIEPMVTLTYLQSKEESELKIRQPAKFPYAGGYFPKEYKIDYDSKYKLHKIVLKEFEEQEED